MAIEPYYFSVTTPAGTRQSAPLTTAITMPVRTVNSIRWRVPPGPRGALGFLLAMGGVPVLPTNKGNYIVADNDEDTWQLTNLPDSGAWQVISYNTGIYPHTVFVTFLADLPTADTSPGIIGGVNLIGTEV